jgi:hypothetical protein
MLSAEKANVEAPRRLPGPALQVLPALLATLLCSGCRQPSVKELVADARAGNPERTIELPQLVVSARFVPRSALLLSRAGLDEGRRVTRALFDSLQRQDAIPEGWNFLLTVAPRAPSRPGTVENDVVYGSNSGFGDYREALAAYQTGLAGKIWIEAGGRKIPLGSYQMENTFGMSASRNFMLVFPRTGLPDDRRIRLVLDGIAPGMQREKLEFEIPRERYATSE